LKNIRLEKVSSEPSGRLKITGSKSISNRVLIMADLAEKQEGEIEFANLSQADDTIRLEFYLNLIRSCSDQNLPLVINTENAGTVLRFLTSFLLKKSGKWLLTGSERMQKRPIGILVSSLQKLGADISYSGKEGFPPLLIKGSKLSGGELEMDASVSSQFITSLMMIAPLMNKGLTINFSEKPVSFPYIQMTGKLMKEFGVDVELKKKSVKINPSEYQIKKILIEPDWSSASYWYEVVALADKAELFLEGFTKESVQGDSCVWEIFKELGVNTRFESNGIRLASSAKCTTHFNYDFSDSPDLVPAVLTTCAAKDISATITGVDHLRHKESDRMKALSNELEKIGANISEKNGNFNLNINKNRSIVQNIVFETYKDHRMAMCFAPLVIMFDHIVIKDKNVVNKSYPTFWEDLEKLKFVKLNS